MSTFINQVNADIKRIEFVAAHSCSGKCKHCSASGSEAAVNVIKQLPERYAVESVMAFGGDPPLAAY